MAPDPYLHIAELYDAEFADAQGDVAFFARHAASGPLLVLGCGTGRVARPLAETRPVTGLDLSAPMIERARALGGPATWVVGDMRAFDLGLFAEILIPNAAFCFLHTRADQLACLRAAHRALPDGGPLTLDLPFPDVALLAVAHTPEREAWSGRVAGRPARRTREVFRRPVEGRVDLVDRWFLDDAPFAVSTLPLQLSWPRELEWMLEAAGFWVDAMFGDHAGGPLRDGCDRIIVKAYRC